MTPASLHRLTPARPRFSPAQEEFLEDALDLFLEMRSGHVGKYIYEDQSTNEQRTEDHAYLWSEVLDQENPAYYMPKADNELLSLAIEKLPDYIPQGSPLIDFGVGGDQAFKRHALPLLKAIESPNYIGIDCCDDYLRTIRALAPQYCPLTISTVHTDFFNPDVGCVAPRPALGVMTTSTIGNIYGSLRERTLDATLRRSLKTLANLTNSGWLLMSVDTNQDESSLMAGYATPLMARLFLTALHRMARELPMEGFDPTLFVYEPEWHEDLQLFAHIARATANQEFSLGPYQLRVRKGQKLHLLNSYKFRADFFEANATRAGLKILKRWDHETPLKLYLLAAGDATLKIA